MTLCLRVYSKAAAARVHCGAIIAFFSTVRPTLPIVYLGGFSKWHGDVNVPKIVQTMGNYALITIDIRQISDVSIKSR